MTKKSEDKIQWGLLATGGLWMVIGISLTVLWQVVMSVGPIWVKLRREEVEIQRTRLVMDKCDTNSGQKLWVGDWCKKEIDKLWKKVKNDQVNR